MARRLDEAPLPRRRARRVADHAGSAPVGHLLRRAYHMARESSARLLEAHDVTPRQAAALWEIARQGPLSQAEIGAAIGMEPANVHGLVDRLRRKGLIEVGRDPGDTRRMRVALTRAGRAMSADLARTASRAERMTLSGLTQAEGEQLVALLRKLVARR